MKIFVLSFCVFLSSCGILTFPQDPSQSRNELDCANKCAALGMTPVFSGGQCGCEKKK